jgi:hypothetical protein
LAIVTGKRSTSIPECLNARDLCFGIALDYSVFGHWQIGHIISRYKLAVDDVHTPYFTLVDLL